MNKRGKTKILLSLAGVIITLMVISGPGCGNQWILFYSKPITGQVIDAGTGKPIERVIVVSMWRLTQFFGHGFGGYAKIMESTTDKDGNFRIPFWITFKPWKFISAIDDLAPEIVIYKPGYELYFSHKIERQGFPDDISKTPEQKQWLKEQYSLNPARLKRVYTDEEIWKSYLEFDSEARFNTDYYSKKQIREIIDLIKKGVSQVPETNKESREKILNDIKQLEKIERIIQ